MSLGAPRLGVGRGTGCFSTCLQIPSCQHLVTEAWCPVPSWLGLQRPAQAGISALMGHNPREGIASAPLLWPELGSTRGGSCQGSVAAIAFCPVPSCAGMCETPEPCLPSLWDPPQAGSVLQSSGATRTPQKHPECLQPHPIVGTTPCPWLLPWTSSPGLCPAGRTWCLSQVLCYFFIFFSPARTGKPQSGFQFGCNCAVIFPPGSGFTHAWGLCE